ncbi:MAG: ankyrin repeat domain-containing protein [Myxococcales bacterium]|nr:ankyrin repeat domain-containing protein [Myxococcales bacterium]
MRAALALTSLFVALSAHAQVDADAAGVQRWFERTLLSLAPDGDGVRVQSAPGLASTLPSAPSERAVSVGGELARLLSPSLLQVVELRAVDAAGVRADFRTTRRPPGGVETRVLGGFAAAFTDPLHLAVAAGDPAAAAAQLAAGADPDQAGHHGRPPLLVAAWRGDLATTLVLLDAGAAVDQTDIEGVTPLMRAVGQPATFAALLEAGADAEQQDARRQTVWTAAIRHPEAVAALLRTKPSPARLHAALRLAAAAGPVEVVRALLAAGADPAAPPLDVDGRPATGYFALPIVDYARRRDDGLGPTVERLLVEAGAPVPAGPTPAAEE